MNNFKTNIEKNIPEYFQNITLGIFRQDGKVVISIFPKLSNDSLRLKALCELMTDMGFIIKFHDTTGKSPLEFNFELSKLEALKAFNKLDFNEKCLAVGIT